jgi:hypothetical protein
MRRTNAADKGFALQPGAPGDPGATAAAIVCRASLRPGPGAEMSQATQALAALRAKPPARAPMLSTYLACQVAAVSAGEDGTLWRTVATPVVDQLLQTRAPDGGWPEGASADEPGRVYATAMAVLTLSTPGRLLPLYAR